uniref:Letm1 RBD domain-containing protein n=1 Tax=Globodera pallida TaxID=36090 RepID=A0A183C1Z7_GLOPA
MLINKFPRRLIPLLIKSSRSLTAFPSAVKGTDTVLVVGLGTGNLSMKLLERAGRLIAYELDNKMVAELQKRVLCTPKSQKTPPVINDKTNSTSIDKESLAKAAAAAAEEAQMVPVPTNGDNDNGVEKDSMETKSESEQKAEQKQAMRRLIKMLRKDLEAQLKLEKKERERKEQLQLEAKDKQSLPVRVWNKVRDPRALLRMAWRALVHTYHGFRLFWLEARLSSNYVWKIARGQPLLRKERQQMIRTSLDVARLFPFSLFIIVPFMELLLPVYIKLFPKMMPSTFQDTSNEEQRYKQQLKAKNETAKFLQDSLEEIALARKEQGLSQGAQAYEFSQFLKKIRTGEGGYVNNVELFKFIKLFEDQLTLDNLSMMHLRALCRLLGIVQLGTPEILRFRLRMKLRELKADDHFIEREGGVEVLSAQELQSACRARGMRALGLSEERLRDQLKQWVELSSDDQVPPSLLLLSRAMYFPEDVDFTARIRSIVGSLPKEIGDYKAITLTEIEGGSDPQAKIELLRSIEAELKAERKIREERKKQNQEREEERKREDEQKKLEMLEDEQKKLEVLEDEQKKLEVNSSDEGEPRNAHR